MNNEHKKDDVSLKVFTVFLGLAVGILLGLVSGQLLLGVIVGAGFGIAYARKS